MEAISIKGALAIAEEVNKATGGRITIQVFAGGQLGNERDMYEGAQMGTIDMFTASNAVLTSFIPEMAVLDQPFLFETADEAHRVIDGTVGTLIAEKTEEQKNTYSGLDGCRFPQYLLHPSGHIPGRYEKS